MRFRVPELPQNTCERFWTLSNCSGSESTTPRAFGDFVSPLPTYQPWPVGLTDCRADLRPSWDRAVILALVYMLLEMGSSFFFLQEEPECSQQQMLIKARLLTDSLLVSRSPHNP